MDKFPLLGICLPLFNAEKKIKDVIYCLRKQTFLDYHVYIFDDCSTDNSVNICKEICSKDERFFLHQNSINLGQAGNFNSCFKLFNYKYVCIKSDNDIIDNNYLKICVDFLENNSDYVSCYTNASNTTDLQYFTSYDNDNTYLRLHDIIVGDGPGNMNYGVIRSDVLQKILPWQYLQGNDHIFNFNLAMMGKLKKIEKVLYIRDVDKSRNLFKYKTICCSGFSKYYGDFFPSTKLIDMLYGYFKIIDTSYINDLDPEKLGNIVVKSMYIRFGKKIDKELSIVENFLDRLSSNNTLKDKIINKIDSNYIYDAELCKLMEKYRTVKNKIVYFNI